MSTVAAVRSLRASALTGKRASPSAARKVAFVPRAAATSDKTIKSTPEAAAPAPVSENVVFYRGNSYTEQEYESAKASGAIDDLSKVDVPVYAEPPSFVGNFVFSTVTTERDGSA